VTLAVTLAGPAGPAFALDIAFAVPAGGVVALLGPSGSGKTTILRAVAGLVALRGTVRFGAVTWQDDATWVPPHRRRIGYVPQRSALLPHLTVDANLDFAAHRAAAGAFDRAAVVELTGIAALLDRSPRHLSGGEARRAGIARALLGQPQLLLMDEPLAGLDGDARGAMLSALATLLAAIDVPVVYVTHDVAEAQRLAARTLHLRGGRVVPGPDGN